MQDCHNCCNPVERVHAIANLGLQSVGMRQKMSADMEEHIRNCNSNEELRKAIEWYEELKPALENSLTVPVHLLNRVLSKLSLKDKRFQTFSSCADEELTNYHLPIDSFHENISKLKKKEHLKNFLKFNKYSNYPFPSLETSLRSTVSIAPGLRLCHMEKFKTSKLTKTPLPRL